MCGGVPFVCSFFCVNTCQDLFEPQSTCEYCYQRCFGNSIWLFSVTVDLPKWEEVFRMLFVACYVYHTAIKEPLQGAVHCSKWVPRSQTDIVKSLCAFPSCLLIPCCYTSDGQEFWKCRWADAEVISGGPELLRSKDSAVLRKPMTTFLWMASGMLSTPFENGRALQTKLKLDLER